MKQAAQQMKKCGKKFAEAVDKERGKGIINLFEAEAARFSPMRTWFCTGYWHF